MLRRRRIEDGPEAGMTLVELLIAIPIGMLVIGLAFAAFGTFSNAGTIALAVGKATNSADTTMAQIQSRVDSANVLFNPATVVTRDGSGAPSGFSLRILTVVKGVTTCEQWRVVTGGDLQKRSWPNGAPTRVTHWVTLTTGVINPPTDPPFTLASTSSYGGRMVNVNVMLTAAGTKHSGSTDVQDSFTAFNAEFFSSGDSQFCTPIPTP